MRIQTRRAAALTILAALCVALQLTPRPPNIEPTSFLVFVVGAFFGPVAGVLLGASVMLINGFFSHWGFAGLMLPFQIAGFVLVGVGGGLYGRSKKGLYGSSSAGETAVLGAFLTLIYDLVTNFGVAVSNMLLGIPMWPALATAFVLGAPFSVVHVVSNFFVFFAAFLPLTKVMQQLLGGENSWKSGFLAM